MCPGAWLPAKLVRLERGRDLPILRGPPVARQCERAWQRLACRRQGQQGSPPVASVVILLAKRTTPDQAAEDGALAPPAGRLALATEGRS